MPPVYKLAKRITSEQLIALKIIRIAAAYCIHQLGPASLIHFIPSYRGDFNNGKQKEDKTSMTQNKRCTVWHSNTGQQQTCDSLTSNHIFP